MKSTNPERREKDKLGFPERGANDTREEEGSGERTGARKKSSQGYNRYFTLESGSTELNWLIRPVLRHRITFQLDGTLTKGFIE